MEEIDIRVKIKPAASLRQFRSDHGKGPRILGMIYFNRLGDGTLWLDNIREDTDVSRLQLLIKEGRIYVVEEIKEMT